MTAQNEYFNALPGLIKQIECIFVIKCLYTAIAYRKFRSSTIAFNVGNKFSGV